MHRKAKQLKFVPVNKHNIKLTGIGHTHNEYGEVDPEDYWWAVGECKLLEEGGLYEGIGLDALGLLHSHLEAIATDETGGTLQGHATVHVIWSWMAELRLNYLPVTVLSRVIMTVGKFIT